MTLTWMPVLESALFSHAYKTIAYVASGSWCEVIAVHEVSMYDEAGETYPLVVEAALVNLNMNDDNRLCVSAFFALPSKSPEGPITNYRAAWNLSEAVYFIREHKRSDRSVGFDFGSSRYVADTESTIAHGGKLEILRTAAAKINLQATEALKGDDDELFVASGSSGRDYTTPSEESTPPTSPDTRCSSLQHETVIRNHVKSNEEHSNILSALSLEGLTGIWEWTERGSLSRSDWEEHYLYMSALDLFLTEANRNAIGEYETEIYDFYTNRSNESNNHHQVRDDPIIDNDENGFTPDLVLCSPLESGKDLPNLRQYIPLDTSEEFEDELNKVNFKDRGTRKGENLARAKVDWHHMCRASQAIRHSGNFEFHRLEPADRSIEWFWDFSNDTETQSDIAAAVERPSTPALLFQSETSITSTKIQEDHVGSERPETPALLVQSDFSLHAGPSLHHYNFAGRPVFHKSTTPPAVSFWAAFSVGVEDSLQKKHTSLLQQVLTAKACMYVDPIVLSDGEEYLLGTGSQLQESVTGRVEKAYHPEGTWMSEELDPDDDCPRIQGSVECWYDASVEGINRLPGPYMTAWIDSDMRINNGRRCRQAAPSRKMVVTGPSSSLSIMQSNETGLIEQHCNEITSPLPPRLPSRQSLISGDDYDVWEYIEKHADQFDVADELTSDTTCEHDIKDIIGPQQALDTSAEDGNGDDYGPGYEIVQHKHTTNACLAEDGHDAIRKLNEPLALNLEYAQQSCLQRATRRNQTASLVDGNCIEQVQDSEREAPLSLEENLPFEKVLTENRADESHRDSNSSEPTRLKVKNGTLDWAALWRAGVEKAGGTNTVGAQLNSFRVRSLGEFFPHLPSHPSLPTVILCGSVMGYVAFMATRAFRH